MGSIKGWEWPWDAQKISTEIEGAFSDQSHDASYVCMQDSVSELPLMEQTSETIGYGKYFVVVSYNLMVGYIQSMLAIPWSI